MPDKTPHPVDRHVSARIRLRRRELGMTQQTLANAVGLTFQQIQKYESGASRIAVSRLYDVATALDTSIGYFLEGRGGDQGVQSNARLAEVSAFVAGDEGLAFAKVLHQMPRAVRRHMLAMAQAIAGVQGLKR